MEKEKLGEIKLSNEQAYFLIIQNNNTKELLEMIYTSENGEYTLEYLAERIMKEYTEIKYALEIIYEKIKCIDDFIGENIKDSE